MIHVTRINHSPLVLNSDLIEHIEANPDTVISMTSGQKYVVMESAEDVIERVVEFRQRLAVRESGELRKADGGRF
jgi:flagellar protein FlbD